MSSPNWPHLGVTYSYDAGSRLLQASGFGTLSTTSYSYDDANRLLTLVHEVGGNQLAQFAYTYDNVGNRTQAVETMQGSTRTINYGYDDLYRLTAAGYDEPRGLTSYTYSYDGVGNRRRATVAFGGNTQTTDYTYDDADRMTTVNGVNYAWDNNGNLLSDARLTFGYDDAGHLTSVVDTQTDRSASYTYNGDELRVARTEDGVTTPYVWDVRAGVPQLLQEDNYQFAYDYGLLSRWDRKAGEDLSYRSDALGSPRLVLRNGITVADTYSYDPFGALRTGGSTNNTRRFTGESQDDVSGFLYLRARDYDPATGRFLSRDPFPGIAGTPATQHPYAYALNNPANLSDPSGEILPVVAFALAIGGGAAIGGAVGGAGYVLQHPGQPVGAYLQSGAFQRTVLTGAAAGAVAGGLGFFVPAGLGLWGAIAAGAGIGGLSSGAAQIVENRLECKKWNEGLGEAMAMGALVGGVSAGVGYELGQFVQQWKKGLTALVPGYVRDSQSLISWLKNLDKYYKAQYKAGGNPPPPTAWQVDNIVRLAREYGVSVRLDPPQGVWPAHINFGDRGIHIPVPDNYRLPPLP